MTAAAQKRLAVLGALTALGLVVAANAYLVTAALHSQSACVAAAFVWALRNGQFEDPEGNALRVLVPDTPPDTEATPHDDLTAHSQDQDAGRGLRTRRQDGARCGEDDAT